MNNMIDVRWNLHDRPVVLQCITFTEHYNGVEYIPFTNPEVQIIEGEYADGQPLSRGDFEELHDDCKLCEYVEKAGCDSAVDDIKSYSGGRVC